jgi:hypothetical protein
MPITTLFSSGLVTSNRREALDHPALCQPACSVEHKYTGQFIVITEWVQKNEYFKIVRFKLEHRQSSTIQTFCSSPTEEINMKAEKSLLKIQITHPVGIIMFAHATLTLVDFSLKYSKTFPKFIF